MSVAPIEQRRFSADAWMFVLVSMLPLLGFAAMFAVWFVRGVPAPSGKETAVIGTRPADGERAVLPTAFIAADLQLPHRGHGVDSATLSDESVHLFRSSDGQRVAATVNTSGAGDALVLTPRQPLEQQTDYTFEVTSALRDTSGASFTPFRMSFRTATGQNETNFPVSFEKVPVQQIEQSAYTALAIGPDHRLYAAMYDGRIYRFDLADDGSLRSPVAISTVPQNNQGPRLITGLCFDPASTPDNLIAWVNHGQMKLEDADNWTGKLSRLSGQSLETYEEIVTHLPRSHRDHLNNQIAFGSDGALYFNQASMTACGAPDKKWDYRGETLLSAAILRLDPSKLPATLPLNVKTSDGGAYNPFSGNAPLTIYATGVRVSYDMLWHSSGRLYAGVNGSARGGNTPASDDKRIPALMAVATQDDFLFKIERSGYYGHPNPIRGEFVLNGGNPTPSRDPAEVSEYPVGIQPERSYRGYAYSFGKNVSPNGMIEYQSDRFGGALRGKVLVARFSGGDDIVVLTLGSDGRVEEAITGIEGFTQFTDPLDLVEDPRTGNLYVAEYSGRSLTLLRPRDSHGAPSSNVFRQQVAAIDD